MFPDAETGSSDLRSLPSELAPDGSRVRPLYRTEQGSAAEFHLAAGAVTRAVEHQSVEEFWRVLAGSGTLWWQRGSEQEVVSLAPGLTLVLRPGTSFQFRAEEDLIVFAVTVPPWPREEGAAAAEARVVEGPWEASLGPT